MSTSTAARKLLCLATLAVLAGGCARYVTVESSKALGRLRLVQRGKELSFEGPALPRDHVVVQARVVSVKYPALRSPSLVGDRATVVCRITHGRIPRHNKTTHIRLRFDPEPGGIKNVFSLHQGEDLKFVFTKDGKLFRWFSSRAKVPPQIKGTGVPPHMKVLEVGRPWRE